MHDKTQPFESDMQYCVNRCQAENIVASEELLEVLKEAFAEKVAYLISQGEAEAEARHNAFNFIVKEGNYRE